MPVFCAIVNCKSRSDRDSKIKFYRIPAEIVHQGEETAELSKRRRTLWVAKINRKNFTPANHTRVCSLHFIKGIHTLQFATSQYILNTVALQANHLSSMIAPTQIGHRLSICQERLPIA